jgi:Spy/CpxP family protein refolding chaperone
MKHLLITTIATLSVFNVANADNTDLRQRLAHKQQQQRIETISKQLDLTDQQRDDLKAINKEFEHKLETLRGKDRTRTEKALEKKDILDSRKEAIKSILTEEQRERAEYLKMSFLKDQKKKKRIGKLTPEQRAQKMTFKMKQKLDLTENQAADVAQINAKYAKEFQDLIEQNIIKEQIHDLRKRQREDLDGVLTQEQMVKLDNFESQRRMASGRKRNR